MSHVIEHIETEHVERFFGEAHRVLVGGGCLRIACPDARFLFEVSRFGNGYWLWRKPWFARHSDLAPEQVTPVDFLTRELATPRCRGYVNAVEHDGGEPPVGPTHGYEAFGRWAREGLAFREQHPGDHINNWDFERVREVGAAAGFAHVIRSKPGGSVSAAMQGPDMDKTHPAMSLYVDLVK